MNHYIPYQNQFQLNTAEKLPEIEILSIYPIEGRGSLRAYVAIRLSGLLTIHDARIVQEPGKAPWLSMPVLSYRNEFGSQKYKMLVTIDDQRLKKQISEAVLSAWKKQEETIMEARFKDYCYKEVALGGADKRGHIIKYDELESYKEQWQIQTTSDFIDCFATYRRFPKEFLDHYKKHRSVAGYTGSCYQDSLIIDVDKHDLAVAKNHTGAILLSLRDNYDVDLNTLSLSFTGYKGFLIEIPSPLLGVVPSEHLDEISKVIAKELVPDGIEIDMKVYDKTRLLREPNTINSNSGLYKIPLVADELFNLTIPEIQALAKHPRKGTFSDSNVGPNKFLNELYLIAEEEALKSHRSNNYQKQKDISKEPLFEQILNIVRHYWTEGKRQDLALYLAGFLAKQKWGWDCTEKLILRIAEACNDDETRKRLNAVKDTFEKAQADKKIKGYSGLEEILTKEDLEFLIRITSNRKQVKSLSVDEIKSLTFDADLGVIEGMAYQMSVTNISGDPGTGKSWLGLEMARCCTLGESFMGVFKTKRCSVAFFDQESPLATLKERLELMRFPSGTCDFYHFQNLDVEKNYEEILEIAKQHDLLIFDSLTHFHTRNEDKATEMKPIMKRFRQIADIAKCAIIHIHQRRKPTQFQGQEIHSARGTLQIIYDSDMAFTLRKVKNEGRVLEATKSRIIKEPAPFKFEIESDSAGAVRLIYLGAYEEIESKKEYARVLIPEILTGVDPIDVEMIRTKLQEKGLGIGEKTLRDVLKALEMLKTIEVVKGDRGKKYYYMNGKMNEAKEDLSGSDDIN